ncbi:xanthine dehydrogenase family protein molybdopterin-binding subunit [Bdellovibrionota bacterium FG-1]
MKTSRPLIGRSVIRKEGRDKVTGLAKYVDDLSFPDMIYGVTVRSSVARGRLRNIRFEGKLPWEQFTIVRAQDIPGDKQVAIILHDQPFLVDTVINHPEEPVILLAHPDKHLLEEARRSVILDIEPLPAVFTIEDSLARTEVIWGEDNIFKSYALDKGDVDSVWSKADFIIEGEYRTGAQEQLYIENNGMIAIASPKAGVTVWGSMQCPYYVHKGLVSLFKMSEDQIRIIQTETGGGFGGKEDYPTVLAGHAALLAWKSGKPVKMIYDRAEDMAATTKRHPSRTRHKTAVRKDGTLLAQEIEFVIDGGAYATLSSVVLSRGTIHAAGPYFCPNVRIRSSAVATNSPPQGAFRGFGAPQSIFALERHMDEIAARIGMTPEDLRRRNFIKKGQTTATGQVIQEEVNLGGLLTQALESSHYYEKQRKFAQENPKSKIKKGIGFSAFMHGSGFTGSGESYLSSVAGVEGSAEGKVRVLASSTEIGQGANTIFTQIAADALGIDVEGVEVAQPDTRFVPNSGPTVASRTTMVVGKLVERAATGLKQMLLQSGLLSEPYCSLEFEKAVAAYVEKFGQLKSLSQYKQPPGIRWDDATYRGDAYGTFAWAVYVAEVSVDTVTYETHVDRFVTVQEVGKVINPNLAAGQIEGGVLQGIGYALYENVVWKEGRMSNNQMTNYIIPTAADAPPIHVLFEEVPYAEGPAGAKGIGELPMDGPAPAILNAVANATGARPTGKFNEIPLTPEKLMEAL